MKHRFLGQWITDGEFCNLIPRDVFHRQLDKRKLPCEQHRNRHILFRRRFAYDGGNARIFISADDYYKLYINGRYVAQGPSPSYHFQYNYNEIDVTQYLRKGENVLAVHTLYQGLINRTWVSGDFRHGLLMDLLVGEDVVLCSDETFKTARHTGYLETGTCGYDTHFLEQYDSGAPEAGFAAPDFDDSGWEYAKLRQTVDYVMTRQPGYMLETEWFEPVQTEQIPGGVRIDFGRVLPGCLFATVYGKQGDCVTVRCGQELNEDGSVRYELRANCVYEEPWLLKDGENTLDWFDYKVFRYAELLLPENVQVVEVKLLAQHYPFTLKAELKPEYTGDPDLEKIWRLCVDTQHYGVQEVIHDCMERERGFYLGDGCYSSLTNMVLTGDDSMARLVIDAAFATDFITDTLVTCMNCSFMQECAEYPMILVHMVLWHYQLTGDRAYLEQNYPKVQKLLEAYRKSYETDGLLQNLDKWCVVEWPKKYRHGYDVDITQGKICSTAHIAINAYYLGAIQTANKMAQILGKSPYRDEKPLLKIFTQAFYVPGEGLFRDSVESSHISLVGNSFVYGFNLCPDQSFKEKFEEQLRKHRISSLYLFCTFPVMMGLVRNDRFDLLKEVLLDEGAWKRMLREGATATFEGWGKETKWNTSLFHLTISYAAAFMADVDIKKILE